MSGTFYQEAGPGKRHAADHFGTILWLLFGLGPIIALLVSASGGSEVAGALAPSIRRTRLLATSVGLALAVTLAATLVSVLVAYTARRHAGRIGGFLFWIPLTMIAVPPYVHASAWLSAGAGVNALIELSGLQALAVPGWFAAFWVQTMAFLPAAFGFSLLGMGRIDPALADAGHVYAGHWRVFSRVHLPLAAPMIIVGSGLAAILSLTDFGTPALFQMPAYAMEVFVTYGSGADARTVFLLALPLVAICVAIISVLLGSIETGARLPDTTRYTPGACSRAPAWFRSLQAAATFVLVLQVAVPVASLAHATGSLGIFAETVAGARTDILNSMVSAAVSALLALLLSLLLFRRLRSRLWIFFCLLPLAVPGTLTGIGLIDLWNHKVTGAVYGGPAMPVLASIARFSPVGILLLYAYHRMISRDLIDAALLYRGNGPATWSQIYLPLYWRGLVGIFLIIFALSLGELAATILIVPPGQGALSIRIFNLLHYGSTSSVASLCLFMLLLSMTAALMLLLLFGNGGARSAERGRR